MTYSEINTLFERHDGAASAAEAHGIATGMLCANPDSAEASWLNEVLRDAGALEPEAQALLSALFDSTRRLLQGDDFEFDLALPDSDASLQEQAEGLRDWCQGFLFGIGYSRSEAGLPSECGEIVQDIVEISRLDPSAEGEEDENAFMQIHEYLRAAIFILQHELNRRGEHQTQP